MSSFWIWLCFLHSFGGMDWIWYTHREQEQEVGRRSFGVWRLHS